MSTEGIQIPTDVWAETATLASAEGTITGIDRGSLPGPSEQEGLTNRWKVKLGSLVEIRHRLSQTDYRERGVTGYRSGMKAER